MTIDYQTTTYILGIGATVFGVFLYFRNPQTQMDKQQALDKETFDKRADLIEERAKWERESTDGKFKDMIERVDRSFSLAENHTHTVDIKVDKLIETVGKLGTSITELSTIVNERLPKKF